MHPRVVSQDVRVEVFVGIWVLLVEVEKGRKCCPLLALHDLSQLLLSLYAVRVVCDTLLSWKVDRQLLHGWLHLVQLELKQTPERVRVSIPGAIDVLLDFIDLLLNHHPVLTLGDVLEQVLYSADRTDDFHIHMGLVLGKEIPIQGMKILDIAFAKDIFRLPNS